MVASSPSTQPDLPISMFGLRFRAEEAQHWREHHRAMDLAAEQIQSTIDLLERLQKKQREVPSRRLNTHTSCFFDPRQMLMMAGALLTMRSALQAICDAEASLDAYAEKVQAHIEAISTALAAWNSYCNAQQT